MDGFREISRVIGTQESRGSTFFYDRGADTSLTLPSRSSSWNASSCPAPIFEMNLPEGVLRKRLRLASASVPGLSTTSICSVWPDAPRYLEPGKELNAAVPFQFVDEILTQPA
jgi:serine/threonine-protein kinase HipA